MDPLTLDALRTLARARGLELTDADLAALLPLVEEARRLIAAIPDELVAPHEPSVQYRIL